MNIDRNFCPRCGKRLGTNDWDVHTCTPPAEAEVPSYWLGHGLQAYTEKPFNDATPLYTTPPKREWQGLTEQERNDLEDYCEMIVGKAAFDAIEAKLKEKNA
jgi:hypothetical protein